MIYWKGERFWLGKLKEHPEIMTQGRTVAELEENLQDAYRMMMSEALIAMLEAALARGAAAAD